MRTPIWVQDSNLGSPIYIDRSSHVDSTTATIGRKVHALNESKIIIQFEDFVPRRDEIKFYRDFDSSTLIGSGAFADVYRVKEKGFGKFDNCKFCAVKKFRRQFRSYKDREFILNEVRIMTLLNENCCCPHVISLYRAWQEDGYIYVQTELAERGTLKDFLHFMKNSRLNIPDQTVWKVTHDVASGLKHIHSFDLVHLDIKPANLLIHRNGTIMIGDFGMAMKIGPAKDGHEGDTRYWTYITAITYVLTLFNCIT
jgi:serine/threonine protein kinase